MLVTVPLCTAGSLCLGTIRRAAHSLGVHLDETRLHAGLWDLAATGPRDDVARMQRLVEHLADHAAQAKAKQPKRSLLSRIFG